MQYSMWKNFAEYWT